MKLKLCVQKCKKYIIKFNLEKCAFMIFLELILGFTVFKEGKIPNFKRVRQ